jgi:hypothetical protein
MRPVTLTLVLGVVLGLADPSRSIDLTGTWQEVTNSTCKGLNASGGKIALKQHDVGFADLPLSQSGSTLTSYQDGYLFSFAGYVYGQTGGDTGQGILEKCGGDATVLLTYRILKAKTFPTNSKGVSGKMTTLYVYGHPSSSYSCNVTWERISTDDPGGASCD